MVTGVRNWLWKSDLALTAIFGQLASVMKKGLPYFLN